MKLTTDMCLNKVFHLAKSWGVKMSLKISFFTQFQPFLNTSIKTVAYLMHHLACHHWSKFQTKLTTFYGVLAKRLPKSSLNWHFLLVQKHLKISNSRAADLMLLKLARYANYLNNFHLLKTEGANQKDNTLRKNIKRYQKFISKPWL